MALQNLSFATGAAATLAPLNTTLPPVRLDTMAGELGISTTIMNTPTTMDYLTTPVPLVVSRSNSITQAPPEPLDNDKYWFTYYFDITSGRSPDSQAQAYVDWVFSSDDSVEDIDDAEDHGQLLVDTHSQENTSTKTPRPGTCQAKIKKVWDQSKAAQAFNEGRQITKRGKLSTLPDRSGDVARVIEDQLWLLRSYIVCCTKENTGRQRKRSDDFLEDPSSPELSESDSSQEHPDGGNETNIDQSTAELETGKATWEEEFSRYSDLARTKPSIPPSPCTGDDSDGDTHSAACSVLLAGKPDPKLISQAAPPDAYNTRKTHFSMNLARFPCETQLDLLYKWHQSYLKWAEEAQIWMETKFEDVRKEAFKEPPHLPEELRKRERIIAGLMRCCPNRFPPGSRPPPAPVLENTHKFPSVRKEKPFRAPA